MTSYFLWYHQKLSKSVSSESKTHRDALSDIKYWKTG